MQRNHAAKVIIITLKSGENNVKEGEKNVKRDVLVVFYPLFAASVLRGRHAYGSLETLTKILWICETAFIRNVGNGGCRVCQQLDGPFDAGFANEFSWCQANDGL